MSWQYVDTRSGKIRGSKQKGFEGDEFCAFKGIPYAKPPVGTLRFQDPQPAKSWIGVRVTERHGPNCAQIDLVTNQFTGSDDCLYLNVYTRYINPLIRRPVMIWIHGGGFTYGHGDESIYGADYFMRKDVVLVTINYRLGVLGFLNVDDEISTGNQGLKDQVMALKWVRDNIVNFGGDPDNVTIFGESAGGASVHYLAISPLAKGLFHKVIAQSGVALNPWAINFEGTKRVYQLCERLGHKTQDPKSAVEFLRTVDVQKLIEAQEQILTKEEKLQCVFSFGPTIDAKSTSPFMPVHPEMAAAEGVQVPMIIGHNSKEGIVFTKEIGKDYVRYNKEFAALLNPVTVELLKKYNMTAEDLKRMYFKNEEITEANYEKLVDLLGDMYFVEGIHRTLKIQVERASTPTYFYYFTYDNEYSYVKQMCNTKMSGASHADELMNLFKSHAFNDSLDFPTKGTSSYKVLEQMIDMWVNFAETGRPTPALSDLIPLYWQPVNDGMMLRCLNICDDLRMELMLSLKECLTVHKSPKNKL